MIRTPYTGIGGASNGLDWISGRIGTEEGEVQGRAFRPGLAFGGTGPSRRASPSCIFSFKRGLEAPSR